jgi:dipeptidyl aminopeptidase/acylaminoacyl peptidase
MVQRPLLAVVLFVAPVFGAGFTLEKVMSAPFPSNLTVCRTAGKIAWVLDENGARNIWVAEAPDYKGRRLTKFTADDGQEIAEMSWTPDASSVVYVRGGDFEMHRENPNPASLAEGVEQDIWIAPLNGDAPRKISEGSAPAVSPKGDKVVFVKSGEIWWAALSGDAKPVQLMHEKGRPGSLHWTPDGARIIFTSNRGNHAFVGVYDFRANKVWFLDPSTDNDSNPVLSPDGKRVAFIRIASTARPFMFGPRRTADNSWSIRIADVETGSGRELWHASPGPGSAFHPVSAENQLLWAAGDRIVFPWEKTGWLHLYAISAQGDNPVSLNEDLPFEIEDVSLAPDGREVIFNSNQGDTDRRHLWRVPVEGGRAIQITRGEEIEWSPERIGAGPDIAFLHSDARNPARSAVMAGGAVRDLAPDAIPSDFPASSLVVPQPVIVSAADGMQIHCQLFLPPGGKSGGKHPAAIFFHGGSRRQMLLGWHYMDYYNHAYAMNEFLASRGYVVLSVNYRSGIGYGLNFREALNYGASGASEFNDVMGAGLYLRSRPDVDPRRIASWGGSYGGYLTALALARASDLFAAGVDFHGVHDWNSVIHNFVPDYKPDKDPNAARKAFESSPMASLSTWRSPVLLIHGDDDRNVPFSETVRLVEGLRKQGVHFEELIFPDEIHGFLTHKRWLQAYEASARFLDKELGVDPSR